MPRVQLLRKHRIKEGGRTIILQLGDTYDFSTSAANQLVADGTARLWREATLSAEDVTGVVILSPNESALARMASLAPGARVEAAEVYDLPVYLAEDGVERVVWWDGRHKIDATRLADGLKLVKAWDAAAIIPDYDLKAEDIGEEAERERTREVIGNLLVPVFGTDLLFVRNSEGGRSLIEHYLVERADAYEDRLAFLRAIWKCDPKPMINPLPATWAK